MSPPTAPIDSLSSIGRLAAAPTTEVIAMSHRDSPTPAGPPRPVRRRAGGGGIDPDARVEAVALLA